MPQGRHRVSQRREGPDRLEADQLMVHHDRADLPGHRHMALLSHGGHQSRIGHRMVGVVEQHVKGDRLHPIVLQGPDELGVELAVPDAIESGLSQGRGRLLIHVNDHDIVQGDRGTEGEWNVVAQVAKPLADPENQQDEPRQQTQQPRPQGGSQEQRSGRIGSGFRSSHGLE